MHANCPSWPGGVPSTITDAAKPPSCARRARSASPIGRSIKDGGPSSDKPLLNHHPVCGLADASHHFFFLPQPPLLARRGNSHLSAFIHTLHRPRLGGSKWLVLSAMEFSVNALAILFSPPMHGSLFRNLAMRWNLRPLIILLGCCLATFSSASPQSGRRGLSKIVVPTYRVTPPNFVPKSAPELLSKQWPGRIRRIPPQRERVTRD